MHRARISVLLLLGVLGSGACEPGQERILGIEATGAVLGLVYLDRDGDQELDPALDGPVPGARVSLLVRGTEQVVARATAGADGAYLIPGVPVGSYSIALDSTTLGDSLRVLGVEPAEVVVSRDDTLLVMVAAGRLVESVADARRAAEGRRLSVEGVALNSWAAFGDSTLHVADSTGVLRAVQVRFPGVSAGDSLRLFGVLGSEDGQPALVDPEVVVLGRGQIPAPRGVSTATAAGAGAGELDAAPVRVSGATIVDARSAASGDLLLQVDDGSGMLTVAIDRSSQITSETPVLPGARIDVAGVLVPSGPGEWRLKPRSTRDLEVTVPRVGLAEMRRLPPGRLVSVEAVTLNSWSTFGDANLHLADSTDFALAVRVPATFTFAGDRVRLYGIVGTFNGWPALLALEGSPPVILGKGRLPEPVAVTTGAAGGADGGGLDAALVRITNAVVKDTASLGGDFVLRVDDGTGPLDVLLAEAAGVSASVHPPGTALDVTGLLVPLPGGRQWVLRPRSRQDIVRK